jgi:hypothetical protein
VDRLIGNLRTPAHLAALVSRRTAVPEIGPDSLEQVWASDSETSLYEVVELAFGRETAGINPWQERLLECWDALASVSEPDFDTACQALVICIHTQPGYSSELALPPLPFNEAKQEPAYQPTAAHPRAFRGTKYKPPKSPRPQAVDLRPTLCDNEKAVLTALQPYWEAATNSVEIPGINSSGPTLQEMVSNYPLTNTPRLPERFRRMILPLLRGKEETLAAGFLAIYWALGLGERPGLLSAVVRLLTFQADRNTLEWLEVAARQPAEFQSRFMHMLLETEAYSIDMQSLSSEDRIRIDGLTAGPYYPFRLYCLLSALKERVDTRYLAAGFKLADSCKPDYRFDKAPHKGVFPEAVVERLMAHLKGAEDFYEQLGLTIWQCCGKLDGLGEILCGIDWTHYSPDIVYEYLHLYIMFTYQSFSAEEAELKWAFVRENAERIDLLLQRTPIQYQCKAIDQLGDYLWHWDHKEPLFNKMERAILLLQRLAGTPFKTKTYTSSFLSDAIELLKEPQWNRFLTAPDSSFLRLEEACKSENSGGLICKGLFPMVMRLPNITVACFTHSAARLCKVAKLLGSQSREVCAQTVRKWSALRLMDESLAEMPMADLCAFLTQQLGEKANVVIPRKLQEHITGERPLAATPLAHYRLQLEKNLCGARLVRMEADILASLSEGFQTDAKHEPVRHALQIVRAMDDNRQALRKFLKAHFAGNTDYLLTHALTKRWIKKHPGIPMETWLKGIPFTRQTEQWGAIRVELETDPLEVLKLGTYAGSCLGLGGGLAFSAAAALLDINKQVLYARDNKGTVLARQLVAISEQNELVCFEVYPMSVDRALLQMFHEYDEHFASALGLNSYSGKGSRDYKIECILSENWWDDGAWRYPAHEQ